MAKKKATVITDDMYTDFTHSAFKRSKPKGFSSGSYLLNIIWTGYYDVGYVYGKMYTVSGNEGSGKTTLGLHGLCEAQKAGLHTHYSDMENAFARNYAKNIGVKLGQPHLWFSQANSGEEMFKIARDAIVNKGCRFWLMDSIAASLPQCMIDAEPGDATVAALARLFGANTKPFIQLLKDYQVAALWVNQMRMKIGVLIGSPETEPAGNAPKFYATVRNRIRANLGDRVKQTNSLNYAQNAVQKDHEGVFLSVKTEKNRLNDPFQTVKLAIKYGQGIDQAMDVAMFGLYTGIVKEVTNKQFKYAPLVKSKRKTAKPKVAEKTTQYNFSSVPADIIKEIETRAKKAFDAGVRPNQ